MWALSVASVGMPRTDARRIGNLPGEVSSFVGRRRELEEVRRLLAESRLVTLTGVGGTGKTRLALRIAAEVRRAFDDGVWFVDFTQLREPRLLAQDAEAQDPLAYLVMTALGVREQGDGSSPVLQLVDHLAGRRVLLVLDNCEHLAAACAVLAGALLRACPGVRVLATSRERLATAGEVLYPVPLLPVPGPDQRPGLAELGRYDAVALFVARAQAVAPGFAVTETNRDAMARLCRRLDGLPLAIELAAARVRALAPQQILERVSDRFARVSRGGPARQQTLRACVEWSFDLCSKPERMLWARLSVFVAGFELDAIEGVCGGETLPDDLLDLVAGLVDKSIVERAEVDEQGEHARYRMLAIIRDYGQEQLIEAGEQAILRRRHRDWYRQLAARGTAEWLGPRQAYWYARLTAEHPNIRAAVEFCLDQPGEAEAALRIVVDLPRAYWSSLGVASEGLSWLEKALAQAVAPTALRAQALLQASALAIWRNDNDTVTRLLDQGERLAQRLHDPVALALACYVRSHTALGREDLTVMIESAERGLAILPAGPEPAMTLRQHLLLQVLLAAGLTGDYVRAGQCYQEVEQLVGPRSEVAGRSYAKWALGLAAWRAADAGEADHHVQESLRIQRTAGHRSPYTTALALEVLAWIAAGQRQHRRAATLLGAAHTLQTALAHNLAGLLVGDHEPCERQARDALGDSAFLDAFRHGHALSFDAALAYGLDELLQTAPTPPTEGSTPLTRRERQIADLLAQGLSNKDIARTLVISQRTAESHVEHILTKLGLTNRAQVAAWVAKQRSDAGEGHQQGDGKDRVEPG